MFVVVSSEILIEMTVVILVHELSVGFSKVCFLAHHYCGRPLVSGFDDDGVLVRNDYLYLRILPLVYYCNLARFPGSLATK